MIITTGHAEVDEAVAVLKRGALDYIEKPMCARTLLDRVGEAAAQVTGPAGGAAVSRCARLPVPTRRETFRFDAAGRPLTAPIAGSPEPAG